MNMTWNAVTRTCSGERAPLASFKQRQKHTPLTAVQRLEDYMRSDFSLERGDKLVSDHGWVFYVLKTFLGDAELARRAKVFGSCGGTSNKGYRSYRLISGPSSTFPDLRQWNNMSDQLLLHGFGDVTHASASIAGI